MASRILVSLLRVSSAVLVSSGYEALFVMTLFTSTDRDFVPGVPAPLAESIVLAFQIEGAFALLMNYV